MNTPSPAAIRAALSHSGASARKAYADGWPGTVDMIHDYAAKIDAEFKPLVEAVESIAYDDEEINDGDTKEKQNRQIIDGMVAKAVAILPDYTPPATAGESEGEK